MMTERRKIASILLYLLAGTILLTTTSGALTIPGVIAALMGVVLTVKNQAALAGILGVLVAIGSLISQLLTSFCINCSLSASIFLICGLILLNKNTLMILAAVMLIALLTGNIRSPGNKALLYISPGCAPCKEVVKILVVNDPMGKHWTPVVVPALIKRQGVDYLREAGYKGLIEGGNSPAGIVPCLQKGPEIIRGEEAIKKYLEK